MTNLRLDLRECEAAAGILELHGWHPSVVRFLTITREGAKASLGGAVVTRDGENVLIHGSISQPQLEAIYWLATHYPSDLS